MKKKLAIRSVSAFFIVSSVLALLIVGVKVNAEELKQTKLFDESAWKRYSDRAEMVEDLIKSNQLKNKTKKEVQARLGLPFWDYSEYELYPLERVPSDFHNPNPIVPALRIEYASGSVHLVTKSTCTIPASLNYPDVSKDNQ